MRNAALRRRLFKLMVSLAIYSIATVGFAQGKSGKPGRTVNLGEQLDSGPSAAP